MLKVPGDPNAFDASRRSAGAQRSSPAEYHRARSSPASARGGGIGKTLVGRALSPLFGSRLWFPAYFGRAVDRLLDAPGSAAVPPSHARWYYGGALLFDIDPALLTRRISDYVDDGDGALWMGTSFVDAADWRYVLAGLARSPIHIEMSELIAADLRFRETDRYRLQAGRVTRGRPIARNGVELATVADIDAYYAYCIDLIKSVRDHGVLRQRRLGAAGRNRKHRNVRPASIDTAERDIGVAISEDGELVRHLGGKHRTAIAQALGFASIPVELRLVHVGWLAGEMRRTGLPAHLALRDGLQALIRDLPTRR